MDTLLTIIGILGVGALLISVWVFLSAARRYVSDSELDAEFAASEDLAVPDDLSHRHYNPRSPDDRRKNDNVVTFPATINGVFVERDRRHLPDRRRSA
ncbi:MAG: hypothetical protein AAF662_07440 [Pseudomonadota bacterium]